ncbi:MULTISPECIES: flagellar export chaperone FliS [Brevibacillus]|jgi:flagellar secretion chaperone FliS|uniref:flagellar export chaperone FliS n=1 Tax=Brevibacillus TaxID=55080 RepID=UPI0004913F3C|nr:MULTISPECIES: flagellar export chaperone FliS [Brevibacillus]TRY24508.1 flagellar export chaperone FliS [Brevibacillus sp. LEMMJ03]
MAMYNPVQAYQTNSINTASPGELTLMLYNGAIKFIKQAKAAISEKNIGQAHEYNLRVQDILNELIVTLDRSYPISDQLYQMYDYMLRRMIDANVRKDISILDEVEDFFVQFRDVWKQAMVLAKNQG